MSNNKLHPREKQVLKKGYVTFTKLHDKRDVSVNSSNFSFNFSRFRGLKLITPIPRITTIIFAKEHK